MTLRRGICHVIPQDSLLTTTVYKYWHAHYLALWTMGPSLCQAALSETTQARSALGQRGHASIRPSKGVVLQSSSVLLEVLLERWTSFKVGPQGGCLSLRNFLQSGGRTYQASLIQLLTPGDTSRKVSASLSNLVPLVQWGKPKRPASSKSQKTLTYTPHISQVPVLCASACPISSTSQELGRDATEETQAWTLSVF